MEAGWHIDPAVGAGIHFAEHGGGAVEFQAGHGRRKLRQTQLSADETGEGARIAGIEDEIKALSVHAPGTAAPLQAADGVIEADVQPSGQTVRQELGAGVQWVPERAVNHGRLVLPADVGLHDIAHGGHGQLPRKPVQRHVREGPSPDFVVVGGEIVLVESPAESAAQKFVEVRGRAAAGALDVHELSDDGCFHAKAGRDE